MNSFGRLYTIPMTYFEPCIDSTGRKAILPGETLYDFACKSNAPQLVEGRKQMNTWLQAYPSQGLPELLGRLKSKRESDHHSSVQELQLYSVLKNRGFEVSLCHNLKGSNPDLEVKFANNQTCFVEASLRLSSENSALSNLMYATTKQVIKKAPRLRVWISAVEKTPNTPKANRLTAFLLKHYKSAIDSSAPIPDSMFERIGEELEFYDKESGWRIELTLCSAPIDDEPDSSIAVAIVGEAFWSNPVGLLERKIEEKLSQHKKLDAPLILAIGWQDFQNLPSRSDILKALSKAPSKLGAKISGLIFTNPNPMVAFPRPQRSEIWLEEGAPDFVQCADWPFEKVLYNLEESSISPEVPS